MMTVINMSEETLANPEPSAPPEPSIAAPGLAQWLTLERALYGCLLIVTLGVRFFALGNQPLNPLEAANAWPAWLAASALHVADAPTPTSPLLYALQSLLFWLAGGGDTLARFLPALAGVGLVWLIWYWRDWLGRTVALLAALFLAIDPWLVAFSRLADGAMLSVFLGLLTLVGLTRLYELSSAESSPPSEVKQARWQMVVAASSGLLLVSGAQAWSFVPLLILFAFLFRRDDGRPGHDERGEPDEHAAQAPGSLFGFSRPVLIVFMAAVLLGATGWLTRPAGLGLISSSLTVWFGQLVGNGAPRYPLSWPFVRLLTDQPLLLLFGIIGLVQLWLAQSTLGSSARSNPAAAGAQNDRTSTASSGQAASRNPQWSLFLLIWLFWGIILLLLPGRNPFSLLMIGLPLLFATAYGGEAILQQYRPDFSWREAWLVVLMLGILLISALFWAIAFVSHRQVDVTLARTTLTIVGLALLLVVAFAFWSERAQTRFFIGGFVGLLLFVVTLASSWQLNQQFDVAHPNGFFAEYTHPDARHLAVDIATLSAQRNGDADEAPLQVQMAARPDPVIGWYLRNMRQLTWVLAPGATKEQNPPLVVTLSAQADAQDLLPKYMGSHYDVHARWLPSDLFDPEKSAEAGTNSYWTDRLQPFLRWMIYREVKPLPPADSVVLWVPTQDQ